MTAFFFILFLLIVVPYVVVTLLARKLTLNGNPVMANLAPDDLPEDVVRHFAKAAPALSTNDFEPIAYFSIADYTPDTFTFVALWTNAQTQDVAAVNVMIGAGGGVLSKKRTVVYTDFYALFDNGFLILTTNNPDVSWRKPVPSRDVVQVRDVESAAVVFRLHQNRGARLKPPGVGKFVPPKGEELQWYRGLLAEGLRQQQAAGLLEPGEPDKYVPSWLGAFMISTTIVPPMKRIRRWQSNEKAEAELKLTRGSIKLH
ncbi:MAG: hypothetical protein WBD40_06100 [Tepidisphaeraceae bacterium]